MSNQSDLIKYSRNSVSDLTLSGGVYLGGTGAANYLDDYEEGTYTVNFYDASSGGNVSPTSATGSYRKIGDFVYVSFVVVNLDTTGMTAANALFFSLPFTADSDYGTGSPILDNVNFQLSATMATVRTDNNTDKALIRVSGSGGIDTPIDVSDINSGTSDIFVNLTYTTNA